MKKWKPLRKPYRIRRKKSIFKNRFFWISILILMIFGSIFYFFIFFSFFQVEQIIVSGEERVLEKEIKLLVENNLEKKILFFPTRSILVVDLGKIKKDILTHCPSIAEVEIGRGFPDVLNIVVRERKETAVFCSQEKCFLLDREGIIFENSHLKEELINITNDHIGEAVLGQKVIDKEYLENIFKIKKNISEQLDLAVKEFVILTDRLTLKTKENWEVYFNPKGDLNWQLTKLNLVLKEKIPPERRKDLEYIELRFGDLAPFKYR